MTRLLLASLLLSGCLGAAVVDAPTSAARTPAPRVVPDHPPRAVIVAPEIGLSGRASWFAAPDGTAAAGPRLRAALGAHWRGSRVTVCAGARCVRVRLTDWCQCYKGEARERVIDLSRGAFARLAPLSRGVVRVEVTW